MADWDTTELSGQLVISALSKVQDESTWVKEAGGLASFKINEGQVIFIIHLKKHLAAQSAAE